MKEKEYSLYKKRLSCPIVADFTGQYYIEELTAFVDGPTLNHEQIVTVSALAGNATQRTFDTANYISYCSTPNPFTFELNCGQVLMAGEGTQANCSCGGNLFFTNASTSVVLNSLAGVLIHTNI